MIQTIPLEKESIHDIRLNFNATNIWDICSKNKNFCMNKKSKDLSIPAWNKENIIIKIKIHKTDTVSVIISCSLEPILLDTNGINRLFPLLARVEDRLVNIIDNSHTTVNYSTNNNFIPDYKSWTVTMWHFGRDGSTEFSGERFHITVKDVQNGFTRVYSKVFNNSKKSRRLRFERQEYPNQTIDELISKRIRYRLDD